MDFALVVAIASLIVGVAGTYFQSQQVKMMKAQMPSAGNPGPLSSSITRSRWIMAILVMLVIAAWVPYFIGKPTGFQWDESRPLIQVRDKAFASETVVLDGYEFINCRFDNVTFSYQGTAPARLTNSRIKIPKEGELMVRLRSTNPIVGQTWLLAHSIIEASGGPVDNMSIEIEP